LNARRRLRRRRQIYLPKIGTLISRDTATPSAIAHTGKLGGGCVLGLSRSSPGAVIPEPAVSVGKDITPSNEGSAILIFRFWLRFSARLIFLLSPA